MERNDKMLPILWWRIEYQMTTLGEHLLQIEEDRGKELSATTPDLLHLHTN